jgi:glycosyltransferase involved in cell wall biosynthesis
MPTTVAKQKLRIIMLSNLCPPDFDGGFEMRAFQIAGALRDRGHNVEFVTSEYRPTFKGDRQDPPWVHRILQYVEKGESGPAKIQRFLAALPESVRNASKLASFLEGKEFDLAYLFGLHRIGLATHTPLVERNIPVLWHAGDPFMVRQLKLWPQKAPPYNWLLNSVYKEARQMELRGDYRHIAFVSAKLREYYFEAGLKPDGAYIIPRGVDFEIGKDVERPRTQPPLFFQACRLHQQKGPHVSIKAAAHLAKEYPDLDWRLEIAGAPEHPKFREMLLEFIKVEGLEHRVSLTGQLPRTEVLKKMRDAAAIIHASIFDDPFANTIVEALGAGTPLIGSDIGSIREVVEPEVSALLFRPAQTRELSQQMYRILTEPDLGPRLARAGVEVIEDRYTIKRILDLTEETFRKVLASNGKETLCESA